MSNYSAMNPLTRRQKFIYRWFPSQHCFAPEAPVHYKDALHIEVDCRFSFIDRLRILVCGRVVVKTVTVTENTVGNSVTSSLAYPQPLGVHDVKGSGE
jgi:hypothetical protein